MLFLCLFPAGGKEPENILKQQSGQWMDWGGRRRYEI
nr:MAG TPA: hypothetical protein [Caudoviricetes sp.]